MKIVVFAAVVAVSSAASADPLSDAIVRHADADVATLRGQLGDASARCALGTVYAKRGDLSRAALYLDKCDEAGLPAAIEPAVSRAATEVDRKLRDSDLAVLEIVTEPGGLMAEIDALPGERFTTPITVYISAGSYEVRAAADAPALDAKKGVASHVATEPHKRSTIVLKTAAKTAVVKPGRADFDEGELGENHEGPPPPVDHKPMMPVKYRRGVATSEPAPKPDGWIDDPLDPAGEVAPSSEPPAHRLSLRAGVGAFGHAGGGRAGIDLGLEHHTIAPAYPFELLARIDYSQRGNTDDAIHTIGATAGIGMVVARPAEHRLSVALGVRGDLRLADTLDMMPLHRFGLDAIAGADFAFARAPIVVGARYELGLTTLVPGTREQALIFEVGFELRAH